MPILKNKKEKAFTLIEMLVSMALFSIVIVIVLGSIMTIVDSNRKARSLMTVMNNLNFTVDAMTRSFKTGSDAGLLDSRTFRTDEIDYDETEDSVTVIKKTVEYSISELDGMGIIYKNGQPLTSPDIDIDIDESEFILENQGSPQPYLIIKLVGEARVSPTITSSFEIQTSVSQRKLEI